MSYLNEFHKKIDQKDFMSLLQLWEEYCTCDEVNGVELNKVLTLIFESDYSQQFGQYAESILPLWKAIEDKALADIIFERIIDVQTTNSELLANLSLEFLTERYGKQKCFLEKLRLIGLRTRENFPRAIRNYKLLTHMEKGKFVYHKAGWGTGEIMDISLIREELVLEFEHILGLKPLSFENAFNTLEPLASDHFLSLRFGDPDALEKMAKENPLDILKKFLNDLGPKTASEIKDNFLELIIPKKDWSTWWQSVRSKVKKDTSVKLPESIHDTFAMRSQEISHIESLKAKLSRAKLIKKKISLVYSFLRDFSELLRDEETKTYLQESIDEWLTQDLTDTQRLQLQLLAEETHPKETFTSDIDSYIQSLQNIKEALDSIETASIKKKVLILIRKSRSDWSDVFSNLFLEVEQILLRDYIFKELLTSNKNLLIETLNTVLLYPSDHAELIFWYFQKVLSNPDIPLGDKNGRERCLEAYLICIQKIERTKSLMPQAKKMCQLLVQKKFANTRKVLENLSSTFIKEFILLISKCDSFTSHDIKIIHSLAYVACPELKSKTTDETSEEAILWTTEKGLKQKQETLKHLSTVEMVDVAKEIEEARSHGDLKENSEYKYALERRSRIQMDISNLSDQLSIARVLSRDDVNPSQVGIGTQVTLKSSTAARNYTIMGPWDADIEKNIISLESKLAKSLANKKVGDEIVIDNDTFKIEEIALAI